MLPGVTLQTRSRASPETTPPKFGSLYLHPPLLKIPIPLSTSRSEPSEGTFCTVTSCSPGSRATKVEEPPPSRLGVIGPELSHHLRYLFCPQTHALRRTSIHRHKIESASVPARSGGGSRRKRGSPSPTCGTTPSRKSIGFPPMANSRGPPSCGRVRIASSPVRLAGAFP